MMRKDIKIGAKFVVVRGDEGRDNLSIELYGRCLRRKFAGMIYDTCGSAYEARVIAVKPACALRKYFWLQISDGSGRPPQKVRYSQCVAVASLTRREYGHLKILTEKGR
jgi:hypothetical protein